MGDIQTKPISEEAQAAAPAAPSWKIRSAGRSQQGKHGGENLSYICCMELSGAAMRGLYAIADGALSAKDGDSASESAVETLKDAVQRRASESSDILDDCVAEAHRALRESRNGMAPDEHLVASMVCGYLNGDDFHTAHAGNGAIYLVHGGRIQRLTENYRIDDVNDPALTTDFGGKSLLGLNAGKCRPSLLSVKVAPGDTLLLCSGGITESVDNVSMLDAVKTSATPEETINGILEKAATRGCTHDLAVVVVTIEAPEAEIKRHNKIDAVPGKVIAVKYLTILSLITILSLLLYFGAEYFSNEKDTAAAKKTAAANSAQPKPAPAAPPAANEIAMTIDSAPAGAYILINGRRQPGQTPATINVPAKGSFLLTLVMKGYQSNTQMIEPPKDTSAFSLSVDLLPDLAPPGDLKISCDGQCSYISIDGKQIDNIKFPFKGALTPISLAPGTHVIEAGNNGLRKIQQIEITSGKASEAAFKFSAAGGAQTPEAPDAAAPAMRTTPVDKMPGSRARVETSRVNPEDGGTQTDTQPARRTNGGGKVIVHDITSDEETPASANQPAKSAPATTGAKGSPSFVIVNTVSGDGATPGCRVKFFQGARLAATGYSGEAVKLAPGSYEYVVTKEGYKPYSGKKYFGSGAETVQVFMSR